MNTLSDTLDPRGVELRVGDRVFYLRPPTTEEYDDARSLQSTVRKRSMASPEVKDLKAYPMSDESREMLEMAVKEAEAEFTESTDEERKVFLTGQLASYREMLESRTLAEEVSENRASLARDRWLTARLLCDADGKQLFDNTKEGVERWNRFPIHAKDLARLSVWRLLENLEELPF